MNLIRILYAFFTLNAKILIAAYLCCCKCYVKEEHSSLIFPRTLSVATALAVAVFQRPAILFLIIFLAISHNHTP